MVEGEGRARGIVDDVGLGGRCRGGPGGLGGAVRSRRTLQLAREVEVPLQKFVNRTDLACGTTIGPITAAKLGIRTVDVGNPMLSMHSIREQAGTLDHPRMIAVMTRFLQG